MQVSEKGTGYFGVRRCLSKSKPYAAQVRRGGMQLHVGSFATAEEAALCVARSPLVRKANARPGHMTGGQALQQAQSEGLALLMAENGTGFHGVSHSKPGRTKPFQATQVRVSK